MEIDKSIFFEAERPIRICVMYNPPENSKYCNKDIYEEVSLNLFKYSNSDSPIILIGDLNSRTGDLLDFLESDKNEDLNIQGRRIIPIKRRNYDQQTNKMGKKLVELCKDHDLQILNGRAVGDPLGTFTFYDSGHGASTIDMAVVSDPLIDQVESLIVHHPDEYSQHCKITLRIKNTISITSNTPKTENYPWIETGKRYIWKEGCDQLFKQTLTSPVITKIADECTQYLDAGLVEPAANKIREIYTEAAIYSIGIKRNKENEPPIQTQGKKKEMV